MDVDNNDNGSTAPTEPANNGMVNGETGQPSKPMLRVSYEEYKRLAQLLIRRLRKEEEKSETGMMS